MKSFQCPTCENPLWFDTEHCERCESSVAYDVATDAFVQLDADDRQPCSLRTTAEQCNWVADASMTASALCVSCALDIDHGADPLRLRFQEAKRRTVRQLAGFGVAVVGRRPELRFDMRPSTDDAPVTTGHADGLITLDTIEAEPSKLEEVRTAMGEPYRTPLGHVRHEIGHWWWQTGSESEGADRAFDVEEFRALFGDERVPYGDALESHYNSPDDGSWASTHVSHYAASHAWEDFAESFAHVLHVTDTLETAQAHGVAATGIGDRWTEQYQRWVPLTLTLNALNRSMGTPDPYPFVVSPPAVAKMAFVHETLTTTT